MGTLLTLHSQLEEVLRTEAVAAMAAYEEGIYQTQSRLDSCLEELRNVQAATEQQCQLHVQHIQEQYQQDLEQLTRQYEEQVRVLEQTTKDRVAAAQAEAEEIVTQAAAQLLYALQQQQKAAAEAASVAGSDLLQEPSLVDRQAVELHMQEQQLQQQQHLQYQPQQIPYANEEQQHEPVWQQELEHLRESWQRLEEEELQLQQQHERSSRPSSSRGTDHSATVAKQQPQTWQQEQRQQEHHQQQLQYSQYATPRGPAAHTSSSAPASVSVSRRTSRNRYSAAESDGQLQGTHHHASRPRLHQPPVQLLRVLSATEVLRRASSGRQQLQQGLLEGLRRASEASSSGGRDDVGSSRDNRTRSQLARPGSSRSLQASSRAWSSWDAVLAGKRPMTAAVEHSGTRRFSVDEGKLSKQQQQLLRQSFYAEPGSPWRISTGSKGLASGSKGGQRTDLGRRKPTKALDLLDDDTD